MEKYICCGIEFDSATKVALYCFNNKNLNINPENLSEEKINESLSYMKEKYGVNWAEVFKYNDEELFGLSFEEIVKICENSPFPGDTKWKPEHPIWDCNVANLPSPREAWFDDFYIRKAVKNLFWILKKDMGNGHEPDFVEMHKKTFQKAINGDVKSLTIKILRRFTVAKFAPKVTAISKKAVLEALEGVDVSKGIYCPMAGFGGIIEAAKELNVPYEAYDINKNLCDLYGWTQRDCTKQVIVTDKVCVACPPFGKNYEHWKGTPRAYSDIDFKKWCDIIKEKVKAPQYVLIGPENGKKNDCGLFAKKTGVEKYD